MDATIIGVIALLVVAGFAGYGVMAKKSKQKPELKTGAPAESDREVRNRTRREGYVNGVPPDYSDSGQ